jgi:hypothetical protein
MSFKFLTEDTPNEPEYLEENYVPEPMNNSVYLRLERNRDTITEGEWNSILERQRTILMEHMWTQGQISHTIISQDENGLSLRTEIN